MTQRKTRSAAPVTHPPPAAPHIAILMAVYNGAECLPQQLQSLADQTHRPWQLLASDDSSADTSRAVLAAFAAEGHPVTCIEGPAEGRPAPNFMSLIRRVGAHAPPGHWLAFSDQDDIWHPDRLARGVAALRDLDGPALYCSRTLITDAAGTTERLSAARPRPPGFRNALVQNIASGNTILLNAPASALVAAAATDTGPVVVHDWWIYQLITGVGGKVVHDDAPTLRYCQHGSNQIGANDTTHARIKRIRQLLRGDFRAWNAVNIAALRASAHRLSAENRAVLDGFAALHDTALPQRLRLLARLGLYRQSLASQAALWLAALLGRL